MNVFHLAYTVADLDSARSFYGELLGCQKCIPQRLKWMVSRGRGKEVQAEIIKYGEFVVPHVLPESQNRQKELEKEMQARVAWEKENTP